MQLEVFCSLARLVIGEAAISDELEPSVVVGETLRKLRERAAGDGGRIRAALTILDGLLADKKGANRDPYRKWGLARQFDCYAAALGAVARKGQPAVISRPWKAIAAEMNVLAKGHAAELPFALGVNDDAIGRFARYQTATARSVGHLYVGVLLYLCNAIEVSPEVFETMKVWLPASEADMLARLKRAWLEPLAEGREVEAPDPEGEGQRRAAMGFAYQTHHFDQFEQFLKAFRREDGGSHFVCYRCGQNSPGSVIKSYLVISTPRPGRDYHTFAHFYRVPSLGAQSRVSTGFVVPMEQGVYLVGGQRPAASGPHYAPFRALEAIALSWRDLDIPETLFGGLIMSSNYEQQQIVGRIALRATPIAHSEDFVRPLDRIALSKLADDIGGDMELEVSLPGGSFTRGSAKAQAAEVLELTNNVSKAWQVPPQFRRVASDDNGPLTLDRGYIEHQLGVIFGHKDAPRYVSAADEHHAFEFFSDIRFGMIPRV
jgi:hypothetical protein